MVETSSPSDQTPVRRKKFTVPPIKLACLACRASRTRCNGGHPCSSCSNRSVDCIYRPSRRGGPRTRQHGSTRREPQTQPVSGQNSSIVTVEDAVPQSPLSIMNYIDPGAGLRQLQDVLQDSDFIFDTLFMSLPGVEAPEIPSLGPQDAGPVVKTYSSDRYILEAYYIWIHDFFPILPPLDQPTFTDSFRQLRDLGDDQCLPSSPIALAISAILALIPCPGDRHHAETEHVVFRRSYAQLLAQAAMESIEIETEIPESSVEPPKALHEDSEARGRTPFHPLVPPELESIIALDLLSVYEYAQRGNLKKMRNRAGQALVSAMVLSLHSQSDEEDEFSEARRRAWWMTYICNCQGSIVSNEEPTFAVFAPSFTCKYPSLQADPEAWSIFIQAQQAILGATQFVIALNKALSSNSSMEHIYDRMRQMELFLEPLVSRSETWSVEVPLLSRSAPGEAAVAHSLRCMARVKLNSARIKVHRYCAFFDVPVFSVKHCDLKSTAEKSAESQEPSRWPACSCSSTNFSNPQPSATSELSSMSPSNVDSQSSSSPGTVSRASQPVVAVLPFSSHFSAKICLKSALGIAQAFDSLPYPNSVGNLSDMDTMFLGTSSTVIAPRTMPSFACCAMQGAYALLMVRQKTTALYPDSSPLVENLLGRLQQGLTSILAMLENYATAFEALGGMRDQIRNAVESSMIFSAAGENAGDVWL